MFLRHSRPEGAIFVFSVDAYFQLETWTICLLMLYFFLLIPHPALGGPYKALGGLVRPLGAF